MPFSSSKRKFRLKAKQTFVDEPLNVEASLVHPLATPDSGGHVFLVGVITLLAAALRLLYLGRKSLWNDEAASWLIAQLDWPQFHVVISVQELNMALYYLVLRGWLHLGSSEAVIRGLSLLPAVATVPLMYLLGKRLFDRYAGTIACLLLAIHGAHVSYSQEARGYTLAVFLSSLSMLLFVRLLDAPDMGSVTLYGVVTGLALYAHFFSALIVPAQWISVIALPRNRIPWPQLVAATALIGVLAAPIVIWAPSHDKGQLAWVEATSWRSLLHLTAFLLGSGIRVAIFVVLWFIDLRRFRDLRREGESGWPYALVTSWLMTPIVLVLLGSLWRPLLVPRFLLICVPAVVLLGAQGLRLLSPPWLRRATLAVLSVLLLGSVFTYYTHPKDDWRAATSFVLSQAQTGDAVLVWKAQQPFEYYRRGVRVRDGVAVFDGWDGLIPADTSMTVFAAVHRRVWLVANDGRWSNDAEFDNLAVRLARGYRNRQTHSFTGIQVALFEN